MPVTKAQAQKLLDPDIVRAADVPGLASRYAETYIKRRVWAIENQAVIDLAQVYRTMWRAMRDDAEALPLEGRAAGLWGDLARQHIEAMRAPLLAIVARGILHAWYTGFTGRAWMLDMVTTVGVNYRPPPVEQVMDRANTFHEDVYTDLIRWLPETSVLWRQYGNELDDLLVRVRTAIFTGMGAGEGMDPIMRRVRDTLGLDVDWINNRRGSAVILQGTRSNFNRVQTITRTTVNKAANDGAIEVFRQNEAVLLGYRWLTGRDERVCPTCRGLAGTLYPLRDQFRPPAHPNCRCTIIPEVDPKFLAPPDVLAAPPGLTMDEWEQQMGAVVF